MIHHPATLIIKVYRLCSPVNQLNQMPRFVIRDTVHNTYIELRGMLRSIELRGK